MALTKIIRNVSGADRQVINRVLANNESFTIPYHLWLECASDTTLAADISAGNLIVNDGTSDLSIAEGLELIQRFQFDSANKISFDNTTNDFISTNVQDAIEEAQNTAVAFSRFTIICTFNGVISNNQWLGYTESLPGKQVPIRIAYKCRLREIAFSYHRSDLLGIPLGGEQIDGLFKIFKNGLTDPTNVVHTETFSNQVGGKIISGLVIDFNAGDFFVGRWIDQGDNPSDMSIVYYFEPVQ